MRFLALILLLIDTGPFTAKYSHYWPPLGGTNCSNFQNGECVSRMASGKRWQDYVGVGCACPIEWPFGTIVRQGDSEWVCLDRGGKITYDDQGIPYIDFLEPVPRYGAGTLISVTLEVPLGMNDLSAGEVDGSEPEYEVGPLFESYRELNVSKSSQEGIQPNAYGDAEEDGDIASDGWKGEAELILEKRALLFEPAIDEGALQDPVYSGHWEPVLNQNEQYVLK